MCYLFSSKSFIVSSLTFRSLIHFKFIFMYDIRKCSNFILLHIAYFPAPLIEEAIFAQLYILTSFVKKKQKQKKLPIGASICLWALHLVPLINISVFVPVPYCLDGCGFVVGPEVRQVYSSSSILIPQDCFGYSRFSLFPYKL